MAIDKGNPKFTNSNLNLSFTMQGQPASDELARVVTVVDKENVSISNLEFSSNSEYSKIHNNDITYNINVNNTNNIYSINWNLKPNVGTHPNKTTSVEYGLLNESTIPNTGGKYQLKGTSNFDPSRILAGQRYFDAQIKINGLDGDTNRKVLFNTASSFNGDSIQTKGVAQGYYNYDEPYTIFNTSAPVNWVSFQKANGSTSDSISIKSFTNDISTGDNAHYLVVKANSPSVLYGDISGKHTVNYNISKDSNGNSISNSYAGSVTFTSNNGNAFVTTDSDKTSAELKPRSATITYTLDDYNTSSSGLSNTIAGSFTINQDGGKITPNDPELTYSWDIVSGADYVANSEVIFTNVNANQNNGGIQHYSYGNKFVINVKDNNGTYGSITGTPVIGKSTDVVNIYNPKPLYKTGTFIINGLRTNTAVNTSDRNITVRSSVSGNYCTNFNVTSPVIDTTITQKGSNWNDIPGVVGSLSISLENPQTDKIDQSNPASFKIKKPTESNYSSSLSNITLYGSQAPNFNDSNTFSYEFGTITPSSTNVKVSGNIKVKDPKNKTFGFMGGTLDVEIYPESLLFEAGFTKGVDPLIWKLKFTPDSVQNNAQYTNVNSAEFRVVQEGIEEGSEKTYKSALINGKSSEGWMTVKNTCEFNWNDYKEFTIFNPSKMVLNAEPNRTKIDIIQIDNYRPIYENNTVSFETKIKNSSLSTERTVDLTLNSSDSNVTLDKTSISGFTQSSEPIDCTVSLSYKDINDVNNKYVDLIGSEITISDRDTHLLSVKRGTTGHTNNHITGFNARQDGDNDVLTITTNDESPLWYKSNDSVEIKLKGNAKGSNLGEYYINGSIRDLNPTMRVHIPGDPVETPYVYWYSGTKNVFNSINWQQISTDASTLSISVPGNKPIYSKYDPKLSKISDNIKDVNLFKLTRGMPNSGTLSTYYKLESSVGNFSEDIFDSNTIGSIKEVKRTETSDGFGSVKISHSSTNISFKSIDSSMTVTFGDLHGESNDYSNYYVIGPNAILNSPALTDDGFGKVTDYIANGIIKATKGDFYGTSGNVPDFPRSIHFGNISAFTPNKSFTIEMDVNPYVKYDYEARIWADGHYDENDNLIEVTYTGSASTSYLGQDKVYSFIEYEWSNGTRANSTVWYPDNIKPANENYDTAPISCNVGIRYNMNNKTLIKKYSGYFTVFKTNLKFKGTLVCSEDKTITAFDKQQFYVTTAKVSDYKATARSGKYSEDWSGKYKYVLNSKTERLIANKGLDANTLGVASFKYTLKSPDLISDAYVSTPLKEEHTVYLYCYGKSFYNG